MIDALNSLITDLDGDGCLDIFVSNGGGRELLKKGILLCLTTIYCWGGQATESDNYTVFWGGRGCAWKASVEMGLVGQGRYCIYMCLASMAVAFLDLCSAQNRVVTNDVHVCIITAFAITAWPKWQAVASWFNLMITKKQALYLTYYLPHLLSSFYLLEMITWNLFLLR